MDAALETRTEPLLSRSTQRRLNRRRNPGDLGATQGNNDVDGVVRQQAIAHLGVSALLADCLLLNQQSLLALAQVERDRTDDRGAHRYGDRPRPLLAEAER